MEADALQTALPGYPYKLVANIPYYIIRSSTFQSKMREENALHSLSCWFKRGCSKNMRQRGNHSILSLQTQCSETENYRPGS